MTARELAGCAIVLGAIGPQGAAADGPLYSGMLYETDGSPTHVVPGDLDGDGDTDLLAVYGFGVMRVLSNDGSSRLSVEETFPLDIESAWSTAVVVDANRDGVLDVLAVDTRDSAVDVFLGRGDRTFEPAVSYSLPGGQSSSFEDLHAADLNGDGAPDLYMPNRSTGSIMLLFNDGVGGFGETGVLPYGGGDDLASGDLDNDGDVDLLVAGRRGLDQVVWPLLNDGAGLFTEGAVSPAVRASGGLALGDLDGDGVPDAVIADRSNDAIVVFRGVGDGRFAQPLAYESWSEPFGVGLVDFSGDGVPDVYALHDGRLSFFRNDGGGVLGERALLPIGPGVTSASVVHLDANARPDLSVATARGVSVLLGGGAGPFGVSTIEFDRFLLEYHVEELTRDDLPDILVGLSSNGETRALINRGGQRFDERPIAGLPGFSIGTGFGDFDGDGDTDFVRAGIAADASVFLNDGDGGFTSRVVPGNPNYTRFTSGEFTGDGVTDLVTLGRTGTTLEILEGDGAGGFTPVIAGAALRPRTVLTADVNNDGNDDVVMGSGRGIEIYEGDGASGFRYPGPFGGPSPFIDAVDLNGDGFVEIVASSESSQAGALIYPNNGTGFGDPVIALSGGRVTSGDLDADGRPDLVFAGGREIAVFLNTGVGAVPFEPQPTLRIPVGSGDFTESAGLAVADMDADGVPEIVADYPFLGQSLFIYENLLTPPPGCNDADISEPFGVVDLADINVFITGITTGNAVSDLDGDGVFDLDDITSFVAAFTAGCP